MKKIFFPFLVLLLLYGFVDNQFAQNQNVTVDLVVFEPLPEIDLAAFIVNDDISGAPRIMQLIINPSGVQVIVDFEISWNGGSGSSFSPVVWATTKPFSSRSFSNDEISDLPDIDIEDSDSDGDLLDELRQLGNPSGAFQISVSVSSPDGSFPTVGDSETIEFSNPSQSFTILSPQSESVENVGGVTATWSFVSDATYEIRANVRQNTDDSFEEALESGNPLIGNINVGSTTQVNLRQYLEREWLPGQEIVLQVTAIIPRPGTPERLPSSIVNFYLEDPTSNQGGGQRSNERILGDLASSVISYYSDESRQSSNDDSYNDFMQQTQRFFNRLQSGAVSFAEIKQITDETGTVITEVEFQAVMTYLQTNPDKIVSMRFINN